MIRLTHAVFDLGHHDIRLALFATSSSTPAFTTFQVRSAGITKGKISDASAFKSKIQELLERIHGEFLVDFHDVTVIVPAFETKYLSCEGSIAVQGRVKDTHLEQVMTQAFEKLQDDHREVIDQWHLHYDLDGKRIDHGALLEKQAGQTLSAKFLCATHPTDCLAEIVQVFNELGIAISRFAANAMSLARLAQTIRPGKDNYSVINIGHEETSGAMFLDRQLANLFTVKAGGKHMTQDVSIGMGIDFSRAEALKRSFGVQLGSPSRPQLPSAHAVKAEAVGQPPASVHQMYPFLAPRISEILKLCLRHFGLYLRALDGGTTLCGGGAQVAGTVACVQPLFEQTEVVSFRVQPEIFSALGLNVTLLPGTLITSGSESLIGESIARLTSAQADVKALRQNPVVQKLRPLWTWLSELSR